MKSDKNYGLRYLTDTGCLKRLHRLFTDFPANTFLSLFGCNLLASIEIKQLYPKRPVETLISNGTMQSFSTTM